jgi:DNA-binding response OmpR family regulator
MSVTKYHALLISDKTAAQNLMNIFLKEAGIAGFTTAQSMREAITIASKELPHVIVCYDDLPDATGIQVVEAIRKVQILDKALIFVMRNSTQAEIMQLMKLRIAALGPKDTNPNAFIEKVKQKLTLLHGISPYSIRGEELQGGSQVVVRANTKILGRHEGHVVCSSQIEARSGTMLSIQPGEAGSAPFAVTFTGTSSTTKTAEGHENLFSMSEIVGKGRQWLQENLPSLDNSTSGSHKKLLVLDGKPDRSTTLSRAISIHNVEVEAVADFGSLITKYQASPQTYGAVLFMDPPDAVTAAPWDKTKLTLPPDKKPIELVATLSSKSVQKPNTIWLQKPFSLDLVVQSFKAAVASQHKSLDVKSIATKQVSAQYIVQAKITSLDELGGILQAPFLPEAGTELELDNPFLNKISLFRKVKVLIAETLPTNQKMSFVRFQVLDAGFTKEKLYSLLLKSIAETKVTSATGMPNPNAALTGGAAGTPAATPKVTSLTAAAAQGNVARPLWNAQKAAPMPKFNVGTAPKKS